MGAEDERQVLLVNDGIGYTPEQPVSKSQPASGVSDAKPGTVQYYWAIVVDRFWFYLNPKNSVVLLLCLSVILIGTTNRVMYRLMLYPMANYPFFVSQLTSFIYLPVFWPAVYFLMFFTDKITPEMREFPAYKFTIMGLLDAGAGLLMTFGGVHTTGSMQLLLSQAAIPFTMFFSVLVSLPALDFLFRRVLQVNYKWTHYLGATILIGGILISLAGQFINANKDPQTDDDTTSTWYGFLIFFSSNIPTAFSGVYKEIAFKGEARLDVFYVNAWVATWQFVLGLLFLPMTTIPGFGDLDFSGIPGNLWGGAKCLFGINTLDNDNCSGSFYYVGGYMIANIAYNIVILLTIKFGSAALLYVCSAVILPLADICFSQKWIMGVHAQALTIYDIIGLCIILLGLLFYRLKDESDESPKELQDPAQAPLEGETEEEVVPILVIGGTTDMILTAKRRIAPLESRTVVNIRHHYLSRLGINEMPRKVAQSAGAL